MFLSALLSGCMQYTLGSGLQSGSVDFFVQEKTPTQFQSVLFDKYAKSQQNRIDYYEAIRIQLKELYNDYLFLQQSRDFQTDSSLQKYVSPEMSMQYLQYRPDDLVTLAGYNQIQVGSSDYKIRKIALDDLLAMAEEFQKTFGTPMRIISSYRAYSYQNTLFSGYVQKYGRKYAETISAKPGYSEHQLGLAIDIFAASTERDFNSQYGSYADWMSQNAHIYGRTQSYQKGKEIDGYIVEPRHYRYVGKELAGYLHKKGITFSEFVKNIENANSHKGKQPNIAPPQL